MPQLKIGVDTILKYISGNTAPTIMKQKLYIKKKTIHEIRKINKRNTNLLINLIQVNNSIVNYSYTWANKIGDALLDNNLTSNESYRVDN